MPCEDRVSRQVGAALRRLRLERRLGQKQIAGWAGVTVSMGSGALDHMALPLPVLRPAGPATQL